MLESVENRERLLEKSVQNQENERKRVAVEIHDGIGQELVSALYRIQSFNSLLAGQKFPEAHAEAEEIQGLLKNAIAELRRVLAGLRPHSLDELGLVPALRQETERFTRETNTACRFTTAGSPVALTLSQEVAIYRVVQEALVNIRKHAYATETNVELQYRPESISLSVRDNGKGFKPDQTNNGLLLGHIGLAGMKERAEMLGGDLDISSIPGKGTSVVLTMPVKNGNGNFKEERSCL